MSRIGASSRAVSSVLVILFALSTAGCERAKTRLDREVDRLCAIDGGVHVYETVKLSKENFGPDGEVFPQYRADVRSGGGLGPDYRWTSMTTKIVEGDPSLDRWEEVISRTSDGRALARRVIYVRGGGDMPGPWAASQYSCLSVELNKSFARQVFITEQ